MVLEVTLEKWAVRIKTRMKATAGVCCVSYVNTRELLPEVSFCKIICWLWLPYLQRIQQS